MKRRHSIPQLEELGSRILPSGITHTHPPESPAALVASPMPFQFKHPLAGQGRDAYSTDLIPADAGTIYHLHGSANVAGLGQVEVFGTVSAVGFTATGRGSGTLTLFGNGGSVTVELLGPEQPGFSHLPHYFHYNVVRGTGAYLHLADSGTLRLDLHALRTGALGERGSFSIWI